MKRKTGRPRRDESASAVTPETVDDDDKGDPAKVEATDSGKDEPTDELGPESILARYQTQEDRDEVIVVSQRTIKNPKTLGGQGGH